MQLSNVFVDIGIVTVWGNQRDGSAMVQAMVRVALTPPTVHKLEGTHRVRTVLTLTLTLTLTFDLSTRNHITCRISYSHSLYQV